MELGTTLLFSKVVGCLSDLAWLSEVLLFLPLWATAFLRDTWKSDYWVLRPLQLLCSGLSVEQRLIAGPTQTSINDEKIRQGKITGMMFSELPRLPWPQKPGSLRTGSTDDLGHNFPHQRPFNDIPPIISSHFREREISLWASVTTFLFCSTVYLPCVPFTRLPVVPFTIYSDLNNTCEIWTTSSTLLLSYSNIISQMTKLFNMEENTKKNIVFSTEP